MSRLAIIGDGKMGRAIRELAPDAGFEVVAFLGEGVVGKNGPSAAQFAGADVAIEFTVPAAASANVVACGRAGVPVVCGTTGWDEHRQNAEAAVRSAGGALLWSPNFSVGVVLFARIAEEAAKQFALGGEGFAAQLTETHHTEKKDAPSGTAKLLAARVRGASGRDIAIQSLRIGTVAGTHEITYDSPYERVRLVHEAKDRRVFAAGALAAARWIIGKKGIFTMDDFLGGR